MKAMKRRDFVKGLAAAPVAMMTSEIASTRHCNVSGPKTKQLNVFVHGMFGVVVDLDGSRYKSSPRVRLRAPLVGGPAPHKYLALGFQLVSGNDLKQVWQYEVPATANPFDRIVFDYSGNAPLLNLGDPGRLVVDATNTADQGTPRWTVDLPMPDDICPLRPTPYNYFDPRGSTYGHSQMRPEQKAPIIQVLTYRFNTDTPVYFSSESGAFHQFLPDKNGVARIHLFAEPDSPLPVANCGAHVNDALYALNLLFSSWDLKFVGVDVPCLPLPRDNEGDIPPSCRGSVLLCEERTLEEQQQYKKCASFDKEGTIEEQYRDVINFLEQLESKSPRNLSPRLAPAESNINLLEQILTIAKKSRLNAKPPSNCMPILARHKGTP
jgi:hypothetical protein